MDPDPVQDPAIFFLRFVANYFLKVHLHHFLKIKSHKEVTVGNKVFHTILLDDGRIRIGTSD